jgi:hypothetical protein
MPLAQLSLKLPPEVLADWRRRAAAAGHGASVRDWLVAQLAPAADACGPAGGAEVADRLAQLQQARPPRSARPAPAEPPLAALRVVELRALVGSDCSGAD